MSDTDPQVNQRIPLQLLSGLHQPLVTDQLFKANQSLRKAKRNNPGKIQPQYQIYPLKGVGKCWECWRLLGVEANLRGSTGGRNGYAFYRCARLHDAGVSVRMKQADLKRQGQQAALSAVGLRVHAQHDLTAWRACHHTLQAKVLMAQVEELVFRLSIPPDWYRPILAYVLNPEGLSHFELDIRNLTLQQERLRQLYLSGQVSLAQLHLDGARIQHQLDEYWDTTLAEAQPMLSWLESFPAIWQQMTPAEQHTLLNIMFAGLFFDGQGRLRWILAHSPFDRLLGLPEGGMMRDQDSP